MANCGGSISCFVSVLPEFARIQPGDPAGASRDFPEHVGGTAGPVTAVAIPQANKAMAHHIFTNKLQDQTSINTF